VDAIDGLPALHDGRDGLAVERERAERRVAVARPGGRPGGGDTRPERGGELDRLVERELERALPPAGAVADVELPAGARAVGREGRGGGDEGEVEAPEPEARVRLGRERRGQLLRGAEHGEDEHRFVSD